MNILFFTDNFPPEVNAPASRTFEHCREWARAGHQVTVITCAPNFPAGKVFPGYRNRLWQRETLEGIEVVRVWTYITANAGFFLRTLDYLSFMLAGGVAGMLVGKPDVVIGTSPQFFTACAAWWVSWLRRKPFVFELRDFWPESIKTVGAMEDNAALRFLEKIELFLYRRAASIVAVTHSFKKTLIARGIDGGKIQVVTNGVDMSRFKPRPKDQALLRRHGLEGKFVVGYIGTHGLAHCLETLLEAANTLRRLPEAQDIHFLFLGDGARKQALAGQAAALGLANVTFVDSVPKEEVACYWSLLDVAVIHLKKSPLFTQVIPSKLFECMGMGIPVLHGVVGESADIVAREGMGLLFEPENAGQLCSNLLRIRDEAGLLERLQARALQAAAKYGRSALAKSMLDALERQAVAVGKIRKVLV